jgi:membrane protein YdbS with pleckstrin-like domain
VKAWLWLSGAVETDRERAVCLQKVLQVDPDNAAAMRGLSKLISAGKVSVRGDEEPPAQPQETEGEGADVPSLPPAVVAAPSDRSSRPSTTARRADRARQFTVRPSLVPLLIVSLLTAVFFGALFAFLNRALAANPLIVAVTRFALLAMVAFLGIRIFVAFLGRLFTRYSLTSEHLIVERGILSRSRKTIPIQRIQDVATRQSVIERPFGIGDVVVETAGERGSITRDDLPRCNDYTNRILQAVEEREMTKQRATST